MVTFHQPHLFVHIYSINLMALTSQVCPVMEQLHIYYDQEQVTDLVSEF